MRSETVSDSDTVKLLQKITLENDVGKLCQ
jgi:hypothetical protein